MPKRKEPAIIKNYALFLNLLIAPPRQFGRRIIALTRKFGSLEEPKLYDAFQVIGRKGYKTILRPKETAHKKRVGFLSKLKKSGRLLEFFHDIKKICSDYGLGREWVSTIADIVISGFFHPPTYNLAVKIDRDRKEIILYLNTTTTLADIEDAWKYIMEEKTKAFGKSRGRYLTKKAPEHYLLLARDFIANQKTSERDSSTMEKYRLKDEDRIGKLFEDAEDISEEADLRRVNLVRTLRKRFKKRYGVTNSPS